MPTLLVEEINNVWDIDSKGVELPKEISVLYQEFIIAPLEINNHMQKIKLESVYYFWMAIEQSSFPNRNKITPIIE